MCPVTSQSNSIRKATKCCFTISLGASGWARFLSVRPLASDQAIEQLRLDIEAGALQLRDGVLEIKQPPLPSQTQNAKRARKMQMTPVRFPPAIHVVDDQFIRSQLLRQENGFTFTRTKLGLQERRIGRSTCGLHFKPEWWLGDPSPY
jgi:hypothetical protein